MENILSQESLPFVVEGLTALLQLRLCWIRPCLEAAVSVVQGQEHYLLLPSGSPWSLHESSRFDSLFTNSMASAGRPAQ